MRVLLWLRKEIVHVLPIFLFFLFFFTLINWTEIFLFEKAGITPFRFLEVAIAAALIGKVILVVDHMRVVHLFRKKPLAYGILWKTALYWAIVLIVRLLIRLVPYLWGAKSSPEEEFHLFEIQVNWSLFISIQAYYLMLFFIFVTFQELTYKVGPKKMRKMFFGR